MSNLNISGTGVSMFFIANLQKTPNYLKLLEHIADSSKVKPDSLVVFLDVFLKEDHGQRGLLDGLQKTRNDVKFVACKINFEFHISDSVDGVSGYEALKEYIKERNIKRVVFVMPKSLNYFFLVNKEFAGRDHPGVLEGGVLNPDASWVLDECKCSEYDEVVRAAIGYVQPFPDVQGDGNNILDTVISVAYGVDFNHPCEWGFHAKEVVENAIALASHETRVYSFGVDKVMVQAIGFGWYHTGTLVAKLKKRFPDAKYAEIHTDRGLLVRKHGGTQYTVVSLADDVDVSSMLTTRDAKKDIVLSKHFMHVATNTNLELNRKAV